MKPIMYILTITPRFNSKIHKDTHVASSLEALKKQLESDFVFINKDQKELNIEVVFGISHIIAVVRDEKGMQLSFKQAPFSVESSPLNLSASLSTTIFDACLPFSISHPKASFELISSSTQFFSALCDSINSIR